MNEKPIIMNPFKFGDKIERHWARYELCFVCGEKSVSSCRCPDAEQHCPNGHVWHNKNGVVVEGKIHVDSRGE